MKINSSSKPNNRLIAIVLLPILVIIGLFIIIPTGFPSTPRSVRASVVYASSSQSFFVFGGVTGTEIVLCNNETWAFMDDWQKISRDIAPLARAGAGMCVLENESYEILLFGGADVPRLGTYEHRRFNDTWILKNLHWKKLSIASRPPPTSGHAIVYHPGLSSVFIFGGDTGTTVGGNLTSDTWIFKDLTWSKIDNLLQAPSPRRDCNFVFDPRRNVSVLIGGETIENSYTKRCRDIWEWNGSNWLKRAEFPEKMPASSKILVAFYDNLIQEIVMLVGHSRYQLWSWNDEGFKCINENIKLKKNSILYSGSASWDPYLKRLLIWRSTFFTPMTGAYKPIFIERSELFGEN